MTTKTTKKEGAAQASAVRKLVFSKDAYPTEEDVKKWLDASQWEGYSITSKSDSQYEVAGKGVTDADFEAGTIRKIDVEGADIVGYVGTVATKTDATTDDDATAGEGEKTGEEGKAGDEEDTTGKTKKHENVLKFDPWNVYFSGGQSVADVLKDGMKDGTPPGFDDIIFATQKALANVLKGDSTEEEKKKALEDAGKEMADFIFGVHTLFAAALEGDDKSAAKKHAAVGEWVARWKTDVDEIVKSDEKTHKATRIYVRVEDDSNNDKTKADTSAKGKNLYDATDEDNAGTKPNKGVDGTADEDPTGDSGVTGGTAAQKGKKDAVQTSATDMTAVLAAINGIKDDVKKATSTAAAAVEEVRKVGSRVSSMENRAPTKKAANTDAANAVVDPAKKKAAEAEAEFDRKMARNAIGM